MDILEMTLEEKMTRAQALFMSKFYFCNYGGFSKEEFNKKMESEFQVLKFEPFMEDVRGFASLVEPSITLFSLLGHSLSSIDFTTNIKHYRSVILHECIHKFFIQRNESGEIKSSGLHKIISKDEEFREYFGSSLVNAILNKFNPLTSCLFSTYLHSYDFGYGANEGYTEWFRKQILQNDEELTYLKLTSVFDKIQLKLESQNLNSIQIMKKFKEGDYPFIFDTLHLSKETGILFIRSLDYLYTKEYENNLIKKYFELKEKENELILENTKTKLDCVQESILSDIQKICNRVEETIQHKKNKIMTSEEIKKEISSVFQQNIAILSHFSDRFIHFLENVSRKEKANSLETIENIFSDLHFTFNKENNVQDKRNVENKLKDSMEFNDVTQKKGKSNQIKERKDLNNLSSLFQYIETQWNSLFSNSLFQSNKNVFIKNIKKSSRNKINKNKILSIVILPSLYLRKVVSKFLKTLVKLCRGLISLGVTGGLLYLIFKLILFLIASSFSLNLEKSHSFHLMNPKSFELPNILEDFDPSCMVDDFTKESIKELYFSNGFSLYKGQQVYYRSLDANPVVMKYDYSDLNCDQIRIEKDGNLIRQGVLDDIDEFYLFAQSIGGKVRLRLEFQNEEGYSYIAWVDFDEYIHDENIQQKLIRS